MSGAEWDFETLLTNGWFAHWEQPGTGDKPVRLTFTYYRSEITVHAVTGRGTTQEEAIAEAVRNANDWLREHPGYQPREPWITS